MQGLDSAVTDKENSACNALKQLSMAAFAVEHSGEETSSAETHWLQQGHQSTLKLSDAGICKTCAMKSAFLESPRDFKKSVLIKQQSRTDFIPHETHRSQYNL